MDHIIINEYIIYKTGFIDGKNEIIDSFKLGKVININEDDSDFIKNNWYEYGYKDGFNYFCNLIDNNVLDFEKINVKNIIEECFSNKIIEINVQEGKQIPIGKFKI